MRANGASCSCDVWLDTATHGGQGLLFPAYEIDVSIVHEWNIVISSNGIYTSCDHALYRRNPPGARVGLKSS